MYKSMAYICYILDLLIPQNMRNRVLHPYTTPQYFIPADDDMIQGGQEVPVREGSLIIWNSALPHSNYPNRSKNPRIVQYVIEHFVCIFNLPSFELCNILVTHM